MPPHDTPEITRRTALRGVVGGLVVGSVGAGSAAATADTTVTIDNVGAQAWDVTNVDGSNVTGGGGNNPELTFQSTGTRYEIRNEGFSAHPFALQDSNDNALLSQSGAGSFEGDSAVDWSDDGDTLSFTLTESLANELDNYRCTVHPSMRGSVSVDTSMVDYTPGTGSVSFTAPNDGARVLAPVSFEMTATDFVVEATSNGVQDGHGHLHVLVDEPAVKPGEVIPSTDGYYHYGDGSTSAQIDLDPGTHTVRLQAGDANHRAYDLTDNITVTVVTDLVSKYDTGGDGGIDINELGQAGLDFANGEISITEYGRVAIAFANS